MAISSAGLEVEIERRYLWVDESRTAIRIEVRARAMHAPEVEMLEQAQVTQKGFE